MLQPITREMIAVRIARELKDGDVVNLGIGLPMLVSNFIDPAITVILHAENGFIGTGRNAEEDEIDEDYINAGGQYVRPIPGACFVHSADSFAIIRGGHIDATILGAMQVAGNGDLANWMNPARGVGSMGSAMDLVSGAKRVIVATEHVTKGGAPKIVTECTYPLTGKGVVDLIVTDLAVVEITERGPVLREIAPGNQIEEVLAATGTPLIVEDVREMQF